MEIGRVKIYDLVARADERRNAARLILADDIVLGVPVVNPLKLIVSH